MTQTLREKLDLFLTSPLEISGAGEDRDERLSKLSAVLGIPVAAMKAQHSALVAEFRARTARLPGYKIIILDRNTDFADRETMRKTITDAAGMPVPPAFLNFL